MSRLESAADLTNMIATVEVTDDDERVCTTADGGRLVERIISTDDVTRRQAYTLTESPFGHEHHNASMQVIERGEQSTVVWTTDLLPDSLADMMRPALQDEFATIVERLSSEGTH